MTGILKAASLDTHLLESRIGQELEAFPPKERPRLELPPLVSEEPEEPPEEVFDAEALREEIMAAAREEAARKVQEAYDEGGYEARSASFKPGVAEKLIEASIANIRGIC